jgi:UDP-N-acetylglucosamine--N-acetylmuramyl-(pentapeptide) pyrophosphoryl-undecaprenol N-acetylglucosamine transferase
MQSKASYRVLFAAGGTGGHVYPAIAIANAIKKAAPTTEILFVGTKKHMEWTVVPKAGFNITPIWVSGFHRKFDLRNLLFPVKLMVSLIQCLFILLKYKPNVVICCGGFVSGPVGRVAALLGITLMLQEQNSFPGVTNRILGSKATFVFTGFQEAEKYFQKQKVQYLGNPVRADLDSVNRISAASEWRFSPEKKTILVMGGSNGAKKINESIHQHIDFLHNGLKLQIIWQCGKIYYDELIKRINVNDYPNLRLVPFLENMPATYAIADLAICRAGAGTITELLITGKPSILVPSPHVAGDHQNSNAKSLHRAGATVVVSDQEIDGKLPDTVKYLLSEPSILKQMSQAAKALAMPNSATKIAELILNTTNPQRLLTKELV